MGGGGEDHVTKIMHPEDPQLGFLTIMAAEAMKEKKDQNVLENYWIHVQSQHHLQGYEHKYSKADLQGIRL